MGISSVRHSGVRTTKNYGRRKVAVNEARPMEKETSGTAAVVAAAGAGIKYVQTIPHALAIACTGNSLKNQ